MNETTDIKRDFVISSQDGIIVGEIGDLDALRKSTIESKLGNEEEKFMESL